MWYLKSNTDDSVYKIEAYFAHTENNLLIAQRGKGWGYKLGVWDWERHTAVYKINKWQSSPV